MGIFGINKIINKIDFSNKSFNNTIIAIDVSQIVISFGINTSKEDFENKIHLLFSTLKHRNIRLCYAIFDGPRRNKHKREFIKNKATENSKKHKKYIIDSMYFELTENIINKYYLDFVEIIKSKEESDKILMYFASICDYIITKDSDILVYNFLNNKKCKILQIKYYNCNNNTIRFYVASLNNFISEYCVNNEELLLISIYNNELFFDNKHKLNSIHYLLNEIRNNESLLYLVNHKNDYHEKIVHICNSYDVTFKEVYEMCNNCEILNLINQIITYNETQKRKRN